MNRKNYPIVPVTGGPR